AGQIEPYLSDLHREMELYSEMPALKGRKLRFTYFGGGTPSYLSEKQLHSLVEGLDRHISWADAEEVTFECEPGTLRKSKLETLKEIGVTRLSLGVEHFDDKVLELNGRAHLSPEIYRAFAWAREVDFAQINIDLIAGMVGDTEEKWRDCVRRAIELEPDSITIYQMELPYNTVISRRILEEGEESPIADWDTKRRWVDYAFARIEEKGYRIATAYTMATKKKPCEFTYAQALWHGADMIGLGVASFSHFDGVHFQNLQGFEQYVGELETGKLPLMRALTLTPRQRLIRELILLIKVGEIDLQYFRDKFGPDALEDFTPVFKELAEEKMLELLNGTVRLTRQGLLRVDSFLERFFEPEMRDIRYT
ncbi:coproporphyrinogen III oxidase family protein, partial [Candidatus Sumerlaeota bacterium]|nr:coproporphyrinogen III oxidase family protein [Candidatus Sumerlaeota bacterium]